MCNWWRLDGLVQNCSISIALMSDHGQGWPSLAEWATMVVRSISWQSRRKTSGTSDISDDKVQMVDGRFHKFIWNMFTKPIRQMSDEPWKFFTQTVMSGLGFCYYMCNWYGSMAQCKTAVSPVLKPWRYCSLALTHWCMTTGFQSGRTVTSHRRYKFAVRYWSVGSN